MNYQGLWDKFQEHDWSSYKIIKQKLLGNGTLQAIRDKKPISGVTIVKLCEVLQCQPGDMMRYVSDKEEAEEKKKKGKKNKLPKEA